MPTLNSNKKSVFSGIDIKYKHDAYDVFTEGIRLLTGKVPDWLNIKCPGCNKNVKILKDCFGHSDFIASCVHCKNINLASCVRANEDYFHISI
jgi:ribosomal protein S27E